MSRGRGRGAGVSFNTELLGLGRGKDSVPASALAPPPKYPPRLNKPSPLIDDSEQDYLLAVRKEWIHQRRNSPFFVQPAGKATRTANGSAVDRYSDKYEDAAEPERKLELEWKLFPKELRPGSRGRKAGAKRKKSMAQSGKKPNIDTKKDITKRLEMLEKKEGEEGDNDEEKEDKEDGSDDDEDGEKKGAGKGEVESDGPEEDEEMDSGTDYANNFFDNGEGYLDEDDDNADEGGIY